MADRAAAEVKRLETALADANAKADRAEQARAEAASGMNDNAAAMAAELQAERAAHAAIQAEAHAAAVKLTETEEKLRESQAISDAAMVETDALNKEDRRHEGWRRRGHARARG